MQNFAHRYISKQIIHDSFVKTNAKPNLDIIVVIPACNEPQLLLCINSLAACTPIEAGVEVFVVINQSENDNQEISWQNKQSVKELEEWKQQSKAHFQLHIIQPQAFAHKYRGVGSARKAGMDEAIRRFASINKPKGVIVSLDADTFVSENYFTAIHRLFKENKNAIGCTIKFKHRTEELHNTQQQKGMLLYEQYLHSFKNALNFSGYPHAIHTIGSAFACRADAYVKQGGMPRRQAGEDFYFLHKLTNMGKLNELNACCVYPSARLSSRVPFGTGPSLMAWMEGDNSIEFTYSFASFNCLRDFFNQTGVLYAKSSLTNCHPSLVDFLENERFHSEVLPSLIRNSSSLDGFNKRFFQYFNAFKIIKYLNFAHPKYFKKETVSELHNQLKAKT